MQCIISLHSYKKKLSFILYYESLISYTFIVIQLIPILAISQGYYSLIRDTNPFVQISDTNSFAQLPGISLSAQLSGAIKT